MSALMRAAAARPYAVSQLLLEFTDEYTPPDGDEIVLEFEEEAS